MNYEFHPLANIFPLIDGQPYSDLVADIGKYGVREPVWLYEGKILDGRNRYRAAQAAGVEVSAKEYIGDDPVGFVVSLNLHRRHLNESQRAMVAAKLANVPHGGDRVSEQVANLPLASQEQAAELLNVSKRSVTAAAKVKDVAPPEIVEAVDSGSLSVHMASRIIELPEEEQQAIIEAPREEIKKAAQDILHKRKPVTPPKNAEEIKAKLKEAQAERCSSLLGSYARLLLGAIEQAEEFSQEERDLLMQVKAALSQHNL